MRGVLELLKSASPPAEEHEEKESEEQENGEAEDGAEDEGCFVWGGVGVGVTRG